MIVAKEVEHPVDDKESYFPLRGMAVLLRLAHGAGI